LYGRESDLANLIIAGDFNTPDIIWSEGFGHVKSNPSYGVTVNYSLLDLASDYHLEQLMHENTRQNHILDLVFSTNPTNISDVRVVPAISDHETISFSFDLNPLMYEKAERKVYLYNQGDFDAIKQSLQCLQTSFLSSNPYTNMVQDNWSMFKSELLSIIDRYIPQVSRRTTHHLPWLNKHIRSKESNCMIKLKYPNYHRIGQHTALSRMKSILISHKLPE